MYREFPGYQGQQSVRVGDWKAVRQKLIPRPGKAPVQIRTGLYDLGKDPNESTDVAEQHPDILARLEKLMREQHEPSKEFPLPALDNLKRTEQ